MISDVLLGNSYNGGLMLQVYIEHLVTLAWVGVAGDVTFGMGSHQGSSRQLLGSEVGTILAHDHGALMQIARI